MQPNSLELWIAVAYRYKHHMIFANFDMSFAMEAVKMQPVLDMA